MRNVVLVSIDSLRADHCGFMGYDRDTTSNMDALAEDGVVFENAIAPGPATPQSMPSIFTGSYPQQLVDSNEFDTRSSIKNHLDRTQSLPERLSELGYNTAGFSPNPFTSRYYGFDSGFDEYQDFLTNDSFRANVRSKVVTRWINNDTVAGTRFFINMIGLGDISMTWESYYDAIRDWVESVEEPYFLWIFLLEPHWPYRPPRRHRDHSLWSLYRLNWQRAPASSSTPTPDATERLFDLYDGGIRHADDLFERLESDLPGDPAIITHADHGEEFGEHGTHGHAQLYDETIRVPFVVGNVGRSETISEPVSLSRLPDIVCSVATGDEQWLDAGTPVTISRKSTRQIAVRTRNWKYIHHADGEDAELYNLKTDPEETENLVDEDRAIAELLETMTAHNQETLAERRRIASGASDLVDAEVL